jgi:hypothetical protein
MNDLDVVRAAMPDAPLPGPDRLAPARDRLLAAALPAAPAGRRKRRRPVLRYALATGFTGAVAAGIAGVLVLAPTATLSTSRPPAAQADASTILARASSAAAARPDIVPRPDQFLYVKVAGAQDDRQMWISIDGRHDGRLLFAGQPPFTLPGCRNGKRDTYQGDNPHKIGTEDCTTPLGYDPAMPTSAGPMLAYLKRVHLVDGTDVNAFGKTVLGLSEGTYLRPRQQAALFQAAGRMPGMVAHPDVIDGAGRHGVGVGWGTVAGGRVVLVFDKTSYDYMGIQFYRPGSTRPTASSASLAYKLVDRVGQS